MSRQEFKSYSVATLRHEVPHLHNVVRPRSREQLARPQSQ